MMPFNSSFRRMLRSELPGVTDRKLDHYEKNLAQLHQLRFGILSPGAGKKAAIEAKIYQKIHKIWSTRRQYVLEQGDLLQIPTNGRKLMRLWKASIRYHACLYFFRPQIWAYRQWYNLKKLVKSIGRLAKKIGI